MKKITLGLIVLLFSFSALANDPLSAEKAIEEFEASEDVQAALDTLEEQGFTVEDRITAAYLQGAKYHKAEEMYGSIAYYLVTQVVSFPMEDSDATAEDTVIAAVLLLDAPKSGDDKDDYDYDDENSVIVLDKEKFNEAMEELTENDDEEDDD